MSSVPIIAKATTVFFAYSHEDEPLRKELEKQLSFLKRQGIISEWHDRNIQAGQEWSYEISRHLNTADLILLLISPDFIASDYCYSIEMQRAVERHDAKEACVIPIILRPVYWTDSPVGKLQALPTNGKPVTLWPNHDEAFLDIATGIREIVMKPLLFRSSLNRSTQGIVQRSYSSNASEIQAKDAEKKRGTYNDFTMDVQRVLSDFYRNLDKMYFFPNIPDNKLAIAKISCNVPSDEQIVVLIHCTLFSSGKSCILFGNSSMYFHSDFGASGRIPYIDFSSRDFSKSRSIPGTITTNYAEKISVAGSNISSDRFLSIIRSIQRL